MEDNFILDLQKSTQGWMPHLETLVDPCHFLIIGVPERGYRPKFYKESRLRAKADALPMEAQNWFTSEVAASELLGKALRIQPEGSVYMRVRYFGEGNPLEIAFVDEDGKELSAALCAPAFPKFRRVKE